MEVNVSIKFLSLLCANAQSASSKLDEIFIILQENFYNIFCVTEHWLNTALLNSIILQNYTLISSFCSEERNAHGCVTIFVRNKTMVKKINLDQFSIRLHAEFCGLQLIDC